MAVFVLSMYWVFCSPLFEQIIYIFLNEEVRRGLEKRGICLLVNQPALVSLLENELYMATMFLPVVNGLKGGRLRPLSDSPLISEGVSVEGERDALVGRLPVGVGVEPLK